VGLIPETIHMQDRGTIRRHRVVVSGEMQHWMKWGDCFKRPVEVSKTVWCSPETTLSKMKELYIDGMKRQ